MQGIHLGPRLQFLSLFVSVYLRLIFFSFFYKFRFCSFVREWDEKGGGNALDGRITLETVVRLARPK